MLQQDTAEKRHVSLLLLYSWELEHGNLIPKSILQDFTALIIGCPTAVTHSVL